MSIDLAARLDVQELLARFCQYLDQGSGQRWAQLFHPVGTFECCGGEGWTGHDALAAVPGFVAAKHGASVRHLLTSVTIDPGANWRELKARAYGPVVNFAKGGAITHFYDFEFTLVFCTRWQIRRASAQVVGSGVSEFSMNAGLAPTDATHVASLVSH